MGRRFWIAWAATIAVVVALYAWWWSSHPSGPGAEAGLEPQRVGFIAVPLALPMIISVFQIAKLKDPGRMAFVLVPSFLGFALLLAGLFAGFFPDSLGCPGLERYGELPPDCTTPSKVRRWALTEVLAVWATFGLLAFMFEVRNRRHRGRDEAAAPA